MSPGNLRARRVNERLPVEDRVRLLLETLIEDGSDVPPVNIIALITGARSEGVVKSVLWDMRVQLSP